MRQFFKLLLILSIFFSLSISQYCNLQDSYTVSFGPNYQNNVVKKTVMVELTWVFNEADFYYNVTSELVGGIYFSFPYMILVDQNIIGQQISVTFDGTYDMYLIFWHVEQFLVSDLQNQGWIQVTPTEMVSSGAYGHPYFIYKKSGFQTTLSPVNNYVFLGGVLIKNCIQNSPCPSQQYRDLSSNLCLACPEASCASCLYASNRNMCTGCNSTQLLSLYTDTCVSNSITCSSINSDDFFIPTANSTYVIPDKTDEALKVYQQTSDCSTYQSIVQTNLNIRQACPIELQTFITTHTNNFLKIFLQGCDVITLANTYVTNAIAYPAKICQVYGDPWIVQFDGKLQTCQNIYNQKLFFQNQNLTINVKTVQLVPGTSAVVEVDFNYNNLVVLSMIGGVLPASTTGFFNGVQIVTSNNFKSEFTFDQFPLIKVWVQLWGSSFFLVGVDSPLDNGVNTSALCFSCTARRLLQSITVTEQQACSALDQPYKTSCNFDVSALHSNDWAQFSKLAQDLYQVQVDFSVNNALAAKTCGFGQYKDQNNQCQQCYWQSSRSDTSNSWCDTNCCTPGTQNIQDGSNIHPACQQLDSSQCCSWHCPGQTQSNGCNADPSAQPKQCSSWTTLPNYSTWQWFCDLYCAQGAWECTTVAGANQVCKCSS